MKNILNTIIILYSLLTLHILLFFFINIFDYNFNYIHTYL